MSIPIARSVSNPILSPEPRSEWESYAAFNGNVVKMGNEFVMLYRALSGITQINGHELRVSRVGTAHSTDGIGFINRKPFIVPELDWERYGCEDPRSTFLEGEYFIFYTALSMYPPAAPGIRVAVALSDDLQRVKEKHLVTPFNAKAMTLFPRRINGKLTALLTVNTDAPPSYISLVQFENKEEMWSVDFWRNWYRGLSGHVVPLKRMNTDQVEIGASPIETEKGWLLIYAYIKNYFSDKKVFGIEAALLDLNNPQEVIGRVEEPLLVPELPYELQGTIPNVIFPSGIYRDDDTLSIYYGAADTTCALATCSLKDILDKMVMSGVSIPKLQRYAGNPILQPRTENLWEESAVFNAAAVREDGNVHLLYRAMSHDNTSTVGYAMSDDGYHIVDRPAAPAYVPREEFELKKNPGGNSGCEDPRLTKIDNRLYMCYTAYNGVSSPRVALTSISVDDFLAKNWNSWTKPVLISPPGIDDKDAFILPEKVKGKYVIFHRIEPDIVVDYVDSLDFDGGTWLKCQEYISPREGKWDSAKIGANTTPIKTEHGWVMLYHGISNTDREYRVGAMLLDLEDPGKVLSRTEYPILEPETRYEQVGIVNNVVFPCGAVLISDTYFVYYGGADRVIGVATISFSKLVKYLVNTAVK
ncbi:hypothetical protein HGB07_02055 [Candidatus Roizmanbacteria bacterium]|nr:hypothetical protein [Candidatus Roizmanbacteria bacterium]